ncbi:MAG: S-layer homology domain-containing protein [Firmicutes bacterium]|nr:S-layer homology domain-containing protein [Bacillota bacterium]
MPGFRSKYVAGNICLLLFAAFLAMTAVGIVEAGKAYADPYTWTYSGSSSQYSTTQIKPAVWMSPLTSATEGPSLFTYYIKLVGTPTGDYTVEATQKSVIGSAYDTAYRNLLELVYAPPSSWNLQPGYRVEYSQVRELIAQHAVYVDLLYRPPSTGGGGGGGGGTAQQILTGQYGTIVVLPALGSATYNVDESLVVSALQSLAASIREFTIADLSATDASEKATVIGSGILQAALNLAKDLVVNNGQVVITFPSGSIDPSIVGQAGAGAAFRVVVGIMGDTASVQLVSGTQAADQGFIPQSTVFSLDATLVQGSQTVGDISRFNSPVRVTFSYNPQPGIDENKLGVYGLDPVTNTWTYVGGKVNPDTNQITANLWHFSQYAVMLYDKTFVDVATHWAKTDVELMASRHVVKGVSDTQFAPEAPVTRAQFASLLLRSLGLEEHKPAMETFLDVSRSSWYFGAVEGAFKAGIIKGYSDGTFKPDARVTREEMATMLVRALGKAGVNTAVNAADIEALSKFADRNKISGWAAEAAAYTAKTGILNGRTATTFVPQGTGTRAEAAVMMKRFMANTGQI